MTDYKCMFEQAVRTLAAIDEALGIGDDGCGDPDQTRGQRESPCSSLATARG
jgi:hypothetical protein